MNVSDVTVFCNIRRHVHGAGVFVLSVHSYSASYLFETPWNPSPSDDLISLLSLQCAKEFHPLKIKELRLLSLFVFCVLYCVV